MRFLAWHVDYFKCRITERGRSPVVEEYDDPETVAEEALLVLVSVEKGDEVASEAVAEKAAAEIAAHASSLKVETLVLENTQTRARSELPVQGIFVYVGHIPNTGLFKGQLEMDEEGYLKVDARLHTNIPGVFAAGESHDRVFRQAVVSAGYGTMAELEAEKWLAEWEYAQKAK